MGIEPIAVVFAVRRKRRPKYIFIELISHKETIQLPAFRYEDSKIEFNPGATPASAGTRYIEFVTECRDVWRPVEFNTL